MTTKTEAASVATLNANLARIAAELEEARQDVTLLERLKSAQDRAKRLTAEQDRVIAERDKAQAAEAKARNAERFKGLSDLRIAETPPATGGGVLHNSYVIRYTRPAWDMHAQESLPQTHEVSGFIGLPDDVFDWIIDRHPSAIPASIRALADDPREAFKAYFMGLRRGYLGQ
jgi:hypothetical protein